MRVAIFLLGVFFFFQPRQGPRAQQELAGSLQTAPGG